MKKLISLLFVGMLILVIGCNKDSIFDDPLNPETKVALRDDVTQQQIDQAILDGIAWMLTQQDGSGAFSSQSSDGVARTALAVTKLCDWSVENGYTPQDSENPYASNIANGLSFILANATSHAEGGVILNAGPSPNHDVYNTGIAMMALAAYRCPECPVNVGISGVTTYQILMEKTLEFFEDIQNPDGGWRYWDNLTPSDNSNTGFAALGILAVEEVGLNISETLKTNLSAYINFIQNAQGGSGYVDPNDGWDNVMKTGNLLFEMALVGDAPDAGRAQLAVSYIFNNWDAPSGEGTGLRGWKYNNWLAMYCMMKGAVALGLNDFNGIDWYTEFANAIVTQQQPGGYWNSGPWADYYLSTVFNLLTLEKFAPQAVIGVGLDIKPGSCPNPINRTSKGVVPMAILGSDDFDVSEINVSTVNIEGIFPAKSIFEDVATLYDPGPDGLDDKMDCTSEGPDGYTDLLLHFKTETLAPILAGYVKNDVVILTIQGELNDGRVFRGEDIIVIVK